MSDKIRTALKGGGRIRIAINVWANGDFHLQVAEDCLRLTRVEQADIPAGELECAEDPDALLYEKISRMVEACHIRHDGSTGTF